MCKNPVMACGSSFTACVASLALVALSASGVHAAEPTPAPTPAGAVAAVPADFDPNAPSFDDRARAASSAGIVAFVGLTLGGVAIPGALGLVFSAFGGILPQEALYIAAVVGGASGAAAGGVIGALPLVRWWGIPIVGAAAAAGSCIGLIPTALFAYAQVENPPDAFDALNPLVLGQSASLVLAMAAGGGAAAITAALLADKSEIEAQ